MTNRILEVFLARQYEDGMALARASDLVELVPIGPHPPRRYIARFRCKGLCRHEDGSIGEMTYAEVGILFPDEYLRHANPFQILCWLGPRGVFHPNIAASAPAICLGRLGAGTRLVDLVYQIFEIITYQKYATHDALNHDAAAWARQHQNLFPIDSRPLKRRKIALQIEHIDQAAGIDAQAGGAS